MWTLWFEGCVEVQRVDRKKKKKKKVEREKGRRISITKDWRRGIQASLGTQKWFDWLKFRLMVRHGGNQILVGDLMYCAKGFRFYISRSGEPLKILEQGMAFLEKDESGHGL